MAIDLFELDMDRMYMAKEDKLSKEYEDASHREKFEQRNEAVPDLPPIFTDMPLGKGPLRFMPV